ncbi:MAG: Unknown protein [uncultured Aureispira sp.]|uniref:Uncharacterized protein n=1 Tax=uncultured Aureispira sp. TaxID=1331704 RepID=A0A6S6T7G7_9BACT|nr:MAG: Unknown protein [uncultured Aureispira sp.]
MLHPSTPFKLVLIFCAFCWLIPSSIWAQDISKELNKATPEWVVSTDFLRQSKGSSLVIDSFGNSYSTGYFSDKMWLEDSLYVEGFNALKFKDSNYFLSKRDPQGTLLWIRYGIGHARTSTVLLDKLGNVYTVGQVRNTSLFLSSSKDSMVRKNKSYLHSNQSNLFICQYSPTGKVLRAKIIPSQKGQVSNACVLDAQGNFLIGGYYYYSTAEAPNVIKSSYALTKLNAAWDILWTKEGDTLSQSQITGIALDAQSNSYLTGSFVKSIAFSKQRLKGQDNGNQSFIIKYNPAGEVQWVLDSLVSTPTSFGMDIACDKEQNVYALIHTQHSRAFLIKFDSNQRQIWSKTIEGRQTINGLLLNEKNHIYLFGNGYTGNFGRIEEPNKNHSYHNYNCYSFFVAKYNTYGNLLGLNIEGTNGTNYCQGIALFKNKILVLGTSNAGRELHFGSYTKKVEWYVNIWLASFYEGNFAIKSQD